MILRRMRNACWIPKATDTHSEYVILIAFPRQQWLRERALSITLYVHCLSCYACTAFGCQAHEPFVFSDGEGLCSL